jgi:hypothetical protein
VYKRLRRNIRKFARLVKTLSKITKLAEKNRTYRGFKISRGTSKNKKPHLSAASEALLFTKMVSYMTRRGLRKKAGAVLNAALNKTRQKLRLRRSVIVDPNLILSIAAKKLNPRFFLQKISFGRRTIIAPQPLLQRKKGPTALR